LEAGKAALLLPTTLDDPKVPEVFGAQPKFIQHINDVICDEENNVRFECSLEAKNDPALKLGKPI
jgi:hypothetical protein